VHLVLDSGADQKTVRGAVFPPDATHKTPEVKAWLENLPRFKFHLTPTSASWLNLVERFFAEMTSKRIRKGSYTSVDDLKTAIHDYLARHNAKPQPLTRTKTAEDILARERRALDKIDAFRGNRVQASDTKHQFQTRFCRHIRTRTN